MRKLDVDEWFVRIVESVYHKVRSWLQVNGGFSDEFEVNVGVHQY